MTTDPDFKLDPRLAASSHFVSELELCQMRLQDESRYPWLVLIPRRASMRELTDLNAVDQALLLNDIKTASQAVRTLSAMSGFTVEKLNIANLGNIVPQLHIHVLGRNAADPAWPGPVWGHSPAQAYAPAALQTHLRCCKINKID